MISEMCRFSKCIQGLKSISARFFRVLYYLCLSLGFLLVCFSSLSSCTQQLPPYLRIASNQWPGYEPLYLARELGYFDQSRIKLYELPNASVMLNAFRNRAVDVVTLTLDEALLLQHDGMDVRILLVLDNSYGADVLMARPELKTLSDLKGKRVGLESGALGAFMLSRSLEIAGLTPADVIPVPVTIDKQVQAYKDGLFDALVTFDPVRTELLKMDAHILLDSKKLPNEIFDVLVVRADVYQQRPEEMQQIISVWFRTLEYIKAHPQKAFTQMAPRNGLNYAEFSAAMAGIRQSDIEENRRLLTGDQPGLLIPAQKMVNVMLQNRLISSAVEPVHLIDKQQKDLLQ